MFEQFSSGTSLLHRTDPRVKLLCTVAFALLIAACQNPKTALAGLLLSFTLLLLARLPWKKVGARLLVVNGFNLLLWLLLPLTYGGEKTISLFTLPLSLEGCRLALLITIKANAVVLAFIALLATSTAAHLGHGMQRLRLSPQLSMLFLFSYRYLDVIHGEMQRLQRAAKLRGFHPRTNLHTYKTYGHLLGMVLVRSWNRADRIKQAMELRGFTGEFHSLHELRMGGRDWAILVGFLLCNLGLVVLEMG